MGSFHQRIREKPALLGIKGKGRGLPEQENQPMNDADLRSRVVSIEHRHNDSKSRIVALEKWQQEQNVSNAVRDERWATTLSRLNKIDSNINRVVWLVLGGIGAALVAFVVGGGLKIP